jgi:hypothetical protein
MTTLGTACADDGTTTASAVAHEEAMGTLTAYNGGLISAFHDANFLRKRNARLESKILLLSSHIFCDKTVWPVDNSAKAG